MNVLLDASVPRHLGRLLPGHLCRTAREMGWGGLKNGELFRRMDKRFDVLITADRKLPYQKNLPARRLAIIVMPTMALPAALALAPKIQAGLTAALPGQWIEILP